MAASIISPDGFPEIVAERTRNAKVFDAGNGAKQLVVGIGPCHVPSDFAAWKRGESVAWDDPDLGFDVNGFGTLQLRKGFFDLQILPNQIGYTYFSKSDGFVQVRLVAINGQPISKVPNPTVEGGKVWWRGVDTDLEMYMSVSIVSLEIYKILRSDLAPRSFTWEIEESDPPILSLKTVTMGHDNLDWTATGRKGVGKLRRSLELLHDQTPFEKVRSGIRRYQVTETWTGRTFSLDHTPERAKTFYDDYEYPVIIDQDVSESIAADNDDGNTNTNAGHPWTDQYTTHAQYHIIYNSGIDWYPGYRFQTVAINNSQSISSATLTINVFSVAGAATTGTLFGNDADTAGAWATGSGPLDMTPTTASTSFAVPDATGAANYTVTDIVQEIVNRAGWASGNNMAFGCQGTITGTYKYITDFGNGSNFATLSVTFSGGGGGAVGQGPLLAGSRNRRIVS